MNNQRKDPASDRILFFSDAVFAIAMTLLALEIRLPGDVNLNSDSSVWHALRSLGPQYIAFIVSFLVIGRLWAGHVRKYSGGIQGDRKLVSLNLFMLMAVAFIPFPTSLFSLSPTKAATIFYASIMALVGLLSALTWWYAAIKHHYVYSTSSAKEVRADLLSPLLIFLVFGVSALIAIGDANIARWSWLIFIPVLKWVF
jgi:uncharacterized membrane protein